MKKVQFALRIMVSYCLVKKAKNRYHLYAFLAVIAWIKIKFGESMKQLLTLTGAITALMSSRAAIAEYGLNMTKGVSTLSGDIYSLHMMVFWVCFAIGVVDCSDIFLCSLS